MVALTVVSAIAAVIFFLAFSQTTETVGPSWWNVSREVPYGERRPFLLAGIGATVACATSLVGALELVPSLRAQRRAARQRRRDAEQARWLWEMSPEGRAFREGQAAAAQQRWAMQAALHAERAAAEARLLWEQSIEGQATLAHQRGDEYFSIGA